MHHGPRCRNKIRLTNMMTRFFFADDIADEAYEFVIRSAAPHQFVKVMVPHREEAGADLPIRGDANTAAMSAKWVRNWSDNSNLSYAVLEAVAPRGFAALVRNFDQRTIFTHAFENLIHGDNYFR